MPYDHTLVERRDYSLTDPTAQRAIEMGLASAEWYHSKIPRKVMKELMARSDQPALRDTIIWTLLLALGGWGGVHCWGRPACVPFWLVYGVMYGSCCDSRWHEAGHGTALKTAWMNDVVYHIASFMVIRNPINWRWSHARHRTDTIIVGRDVEIGFMHPTNIWLKLQAFISPVDAWKSLKVLARNAMGNMSADERDFIPASELPKAIFWARVHMANYLATCWPRRGCGPFCPSCWRACPGFMAAGTCI